MPFSMRFRNQIKNQVSNCRLLRAYGLSHVPLPSYFVCICHVCIRTWGSVTYKNEVSMTLTFESQSQITSIVSVQINFCLSDWDQVFQLI